MENFDPAAIAYILVLAGVLGLVMGSFINCWAWRSTHGESVVRGRSHCTACGHELAARDLVPVFSWLASRGACRYCGEKVSARYPVTELVCAVAFVAITAVYGLTLETLELLAFAGTLLFLSLTDLDERIIPNGCIIVAALVRAAYLAAMWAIGSITPETALYYLLSGLGMGAVLVAVVLVADRAFGRESMGGGDLKLYAVAGFYFGWQQGLLLVILSCFIGIAVALVSPAPDGENEGESALKRVIPFGPSIAAACVIVMIVGDPIMTWYTGLLSF